MIQLNIATTELVAYTNKLEKLHRSAFPNAVRTALNSVAFDVKQDTLLTSARKNFKKRKPNFFKANSRVNMAQGFDLNRMQSEVGMRSLHGANHAVRDLEQQERGGVITNKAFIPLDTARTGKSYDRGVAKRNRLNNVNDLVNSAKVNGSSKGQRFAKAIKKAGAKGYVLDEQGTLWRVNSLIKKARGFDISALYSYEKDRSIRVKPTHFMEEASTESQKKIDRFYIIEAEKQFKKALK